MEELKKGRPENPPSLKHLAKLVAAGLDRASLAWCSQTFYDKKFAKLASFENLDQLEKDRIFNELIIAPLVLLMLTVEAPDLEIPAGLNDYYLMIKEEIPNAHLETLRRIGIEDKHLRDWEKLIEMRYREYKEDKLLSRQAMMEYYSQEKNLEIIDLEHINVFLPPFTVASGCYTHICRGKTEGRDLLFKLIIKKLSRFYLPLRVRLEGKEINRLIELKMRLYHFWNDLTESFH